MASRRRKSAASPAAVYRRALAQWTRLAHTTLQAGRQATGQVLDLQQAAQKKRKPPLQGGDWLAGLVAGPAGLRRYRLYRPPGASHAERLPLLVMLHGCGQDAPGFARATRMNRIAARERFFVLYPEQDRGSHPQGCWHWYGLRSGRAHGEAATLMAAIDQVGLLYPIDAARVAIAGLSAGASMAALMATRQPARFAALVMHSGVPPGMADTPASALKAMRGGLVPGGIAPGTRLPPLLAIHGAADRIVSTRNAEAAVRLWAEAAGARPAAARTLQRGGRHAMTRTDYKARGRAVATLCEVAGLGHAWSGGDAREAFADAQGPDASRLLWSFVARQFAAARTAAAA